MFSQSLVSALLFSLFAVPTHVTPIDLQAQEASPSAGGSSEQLQVKPPALERIEPPSRDASVQELEERGDLLRAQKNYSDALDYYRAALAKSHHDARLYNKAGIVELLMQRFAASRKDFERAVSADHRYADAYNNIGVIYYVEKKYVKAIRSYEKAVTLNAAMASYFSNIGAAYFSKKDFAKANEAYLQAYHLDPNIFERTARNGVAAQLSSPIDRAHFDYEIAKLYAKMGVAERSLQYLRRAMEEGYKGIEDVYKEAEFSDLRKDPRFAEMMAARPVAIAD